VNGESVRSLDKDGVIARIKSATLLLLKLSQQLPE